MATSSGRGISPRLIGVLSTAAVVVAACGSDGSDGNSGGAEEDAGSVTSGVPVSDDLVTVTMGETGETAATESTAGDEAAREPGEDRAEESAPEPAVCSVDVSADRRAISLPVMGGICVRVPDDVLVFTEGDYARFFRDGAENAVVSARVSESGQRIRIDGVDAFVGEVVDALGSTVTATEETTTVLGLDLVLHEIRDGGSSSFAGLFSTQPPGFGSNAPWSPFPAADLYLGETGDAAIVVGIVGPSADGLASADELLGVIVDGLEWTRNEATEPSAIAETADFLEPIGAPRPFSPAADPDGPSPLSDPFSPVEPGVYQVPNLGAVAELTVGDDWFVAPNFPGIVVLLEPPFEGPSFRDVVFLQDTNAIIGVDSGPAENTPPILIEDIQDFIADPPPNLDISEVGTSPTADGSEVLWFDVRIDAAATCAPDDPCSYVLAPPTPGSGKFLTPGAVHRIWWIDGGEFGALSIAASASEADAAWLDDRATPLVESIVVATPS